MGRCVATYQRAPDLPRLAHLRSWASDSSLRPLVVHKYAFGSQSRAADLNRVRPPTLFRQIGRVCHPNEFASGGGWARPAPFDVSPLPQVAGRSTARYFVGEYASLSRLRLVSSTREPRRPVSLRQPRPTSTARERKVSRLRLSAGRTRRLSGDSTTILSEGNRARRNCRAP